MSERGKSGKKEGGLKKKREEGMRGVGGVGRRRDG